MSKHEEQGESKKATPTKRAPLKRDGASSRDHRPIRMLIMTLMLIAGLLVLALVGFILLSNTPIFTITSIDAEDTEHLDKESIAKLASVEEGTTLLTFDEAVIEENLKRNPWVGSVQFVREFPDKLKIIVTERRVDCVVKMSTGSVAWCLGEDNIWIEPINLTMSDNQTADDVALALAQERNALLITDVPASMSPTAGEAATDEVLKAVATYREGFSESFNKQLVLFSAASLESISCTLTNGVQVSLGSPSDVSIKEELIKEILAKHPNQVTYINVRVVSQPSYRKLGSEAVVEGSGILAEPLTTQQEESAADTSSSESSDTAQTDDASTEGEGTSDESTDSSQDQSSDESTPEDTSDLILGEDGNYYTYEQYWGIE